jgi:hypothetical protein
MPEVPQNPQRSVRLACYLHFPTILPVSFLVTETRRPPNTSDELIHRTSFRRVHSDVNPFVFVAGSRTLNDGGQVERRRRFFAFRHQAAGIAVEGAQ